MWGRRPGASGRGFGPARGAGSRKITNITTCKVTNNITSKITPKNTVNMTLKITTRWYCN